MTHFSKFIPNCAGKLKPLYICLEKDNFIWTEDCTCAFKKIKEDLVKSDLLVHYDSDLSIFLVCDASPYAVGVMLGHVMPNYEERAIAFASKTLSKTQRNYHHLDKEAYAIIYGITKFYEYLFGRSFTLRTDKKALVRIFGPYTSIPIMATNRLQRWAIFLSAFTYKIEYISGKKNVVADYLSRLPSDQNALTEFELPLMIENSVSMFKLIEIECPTIDWKTIQKETLKDETLTKVRRLVIDGWPNKKKNLKRLMF